MNKICRYFGIFSAVIFAVCVISGAVGAICDAPIYIFFTIIGIALSIFFAAELGSLERRLRKIDVYRYRRITAMFCILLVAAQIISACLAASEPKNDLAYICQGAENLVLGRDLYLGLPTYHRDYFEVYPNNHMLFTVVYILYRIEYLLTGNISDGLPIAVNISALAVSYVLMCRMAELIHKPSRALVCAVRGMLFTPFVTYSDFFYTDSMAMPFVVGAAYMYLRFRRDRKLSQLMICGALIGAGFRMKGSAVILLIAIILDISLKKPTVKELSAVMIPYFGASKIIAFIGRMLLGIGAKRLREKAFPLLHWVMMSSHGRGGYDESDFYFTQSLHGKGRCKAIADRLADYLKSQGFGGFMKHLAEKIAYTWSKPTFMAGYYHEGFFSSSLFCGTAFLCHFTVLFSVLGSLIITALSDDKRCDTLPMRLCLTGLCIFLMIWEARCRYTVSFFPLIMLI